MKRYWAGFISALFLISPAFAQPLAPAIWLAPMQPTIRPDGGQAGSEDYFQLFAPSAAWPDTALSVSVFKIYPELLLHATDEQLRQLIAGLTARHIALALETPVLVDTVACAPGDTRQRWMVNIVTRLKRLGGELHALAMVGPLVDGIASDNPHSCHKPISDVAADAARTINDIRVLYPRVVVGEIEPVGQGPGYPDWLHMTDWFNAFKQATGQSLSFLHLDVEWGKAWQPDLLIAAKQTKTAGILFGVTYNGTPMDLSDASYAEDTIRNADAVEAVLGHPPDYVIFQSWQDYPRHALPETNPTTMTGVLHSYLRPRSQILLDRHTGRAGLFQEDGAPITSALIIEEANDTTPGAPLQPNMIAGTVPHSAQSALFALRVHTECVCRQDDMALSIKGFSYFESSGSRRDDWDLSTLRPPNLLRPGILTLNVPADQKLVLNSPTFLVTPDLQFQVQFSWSIALQSAETGSGVLIFFGADGKEMRRAGVSFEATWREITRLNTGTDGTFALPSPVGQGKITRVHYAGDPLHQPATLMLPTQ